MFVRMPEPVISALRAKGLIFYTLIATGGARLMCSWDTTPETVQTFTGDVKAAVVIAGLIAGIGHFRRLGCIRCINSPLFSGLPSAPLFHTLN